MAISGPLYKLLRQIQPMLPRGGSLLEIGEANWYGDLEPSCLLAEYATLGSAPSVKRDRVICGLEKYGQPPVDVVDPSVEWLLLWLEEKERQIRNAISSGDTFAIAKSFYQSLFSPSSIISIDMDGTQSALKFNLNNPLPLTDRFDVVINHGTAEHVFNIYQVFRSMHDRCEVGGVMVHDAPFTPWIDHGFYCLQPTLFYDLAHANCYEVAHVSMYEIKSGWTQRVDSRDHIASIDVPNNACLFVVYRKRYETGFCVPTQGYYGGGLSKSGRKAWEVNR